jgi:hypothetical protein
VFCHAHGRAKIERDRAVGLKVYDYLKAVHRVSNQRLVATAQGGERRWSATRPYSSDGSRMVNALIAAAKSKSKRPDPLRLMIDAAYFTSSGPVSSFIGRLATHDSSLEVRSRVGVVMVNSPSRVQVSKLPVIQLSGFRTLNSPLRLYCAASNHGMNSVDGAPSRNLSAELDGELFFPGGRARS